MTPDPCQVEVLDLLDAVYGRLNQLAKSAYLGLVRHAPSLWHTVYKLVDAAPSLSAAGSWGRLRRALSDILLQAQPDVVVSTYPVYADVVAEIYREHAERPFRLFTIITDSISINSAWYRHWSDVFCVANEATASVLREAGVPTDRIAVTGFPVSPAFHDEQVPQLAPPVGPTERRILYLVNTGRPKLGRTLEELLALPQVQLTITVGRDHDLRARLHRRLDGYGDRVKLYGWTNLMPRLLLSHHLVIGKAGGASVQEAIASRCPMIVNQMIPGQEEGNARLIAQENVGCIAEGRRETVAAVERAFENRAHVWHQWRHHLDKISRPGAAYRIAELILAAGKDTTGPQIFQGWSPGVPVATPTILPPPASGPLLCDFHTHTNYSDGALSVSELVDFYGRHGFDCICITDHLADPRRLIGKLGRLSGLTLSPAQIGEYFEVIGREANRAWRRYRMLVMAGIEFNKDGCRARSSAHLLGIDLRREIPADLDLPETIAQIHAQGALAVASHPHVMKSEWGKNTLYLWENQETFAPLLDAWEIANRDNIFSPVGLKRLPFIASSDFHKPKHIFSWKTVLHCEKDPEAIKECIRRNERVSITLYRRDRPLRPEPALRSIDLPEMAEAGVVAA
ncbi:MAG: UDP-N-acetylglucosamine--LPS N-acetylglucosamine transferase [Verrucomicrobiales bacterium]|nr:UDP-N-acetylglucosamine--LPS N-acetylglucosamine transferase [Verrucomicrobiales bacterium]